MPPDGNYVPYKEIGSLSGAGFGVHWATLLVSTIALNSSNFLVGADIGLKPVDLQLMLNLANLIGIPLNIFIMRAIYARAVKPYTDAELLLKQADYYADYDELEKRYLALCVENI